MASDADPAPEAPLGGRTAAEAPESAPARPVEDALAELGLVGPQAKTAAQLGHRLRHAGVGPAIIREAIRHYAERAATIRNAFAYYQPGGAGFEDLRLRLGARFSEDEGARFKKLDGAWAVKP
jgi:hypothetical protein